ncbi:transcriptional regulator NrdR [Lyngbya aestuarii BL J]|uniref:Transcriptional repressor NrdR n=1 Tax=Lyngbya aestuarii BL J TaxID=1348334 RepID=U7QHC8_9CYAN|nr:transcriptional regulator NrdR [Lyngbya aestuarii]ERT05841.1 transcriptional regulator NrdR [Lyngbya aestuarii BL J]
MQCPVCQHTSSRVLESRSAESGKSIRRRRECLNCKHRFTTYERIEYVPITVIKRDGKRESFDRSKLLRGLIRACEKTGIETGALETVIDDIEAELQQRAVREVSSQEIGELVLEQLQSVSEVAYVRFASVYRKFQGIRDFVETLDHLKSYQTHRDSTQDSEESQSLQPGSSQLSSLSRSSSSDEEVDQNPPRQQEAIFP